MTIRFLTLHIIAVFLFSIPVNAQSIINTSSISHDLDSSISIITDLGGNFSRGNSSVDDFRVNAGLGKSLSESSSAWLLGGYHELKGNGSLLQRSSFIHLRYNYEFTQNATFNLYTQWQNNTVLSMKARQLYGFNIDFDLNKKRSSTVMLGAFYENEFYEDETQANLIRANLVAVSEFGAKHVTIVGFLYFQPSITQPSDYRCIGELSTRFRLFSRMQLAINSVARFDSSPHSGLAAADLGLTTSIRYEFHKP